MRQPDYAMVHQQHLSEPDAKGNTTYKKIEPRTRKTDGFFALVHALSKDSELQEVQNNIMMLTYTPTMCRVEFVAAVLSWFDRDTNTLYLTP